MSANADLASRPQSEEGVSSDSSTESAPSSRSLSEDSSSSRSLSERSETKGLAPSRSLSERSETKGLTPSLSRGTLLRLATAGSVDDGKSTLVGRLLHDTKSVLADQLDAVERVSRERGLTGADLALLTDGLRAEREQGITIDVAYRYFATANRSYILADCPGHVQYTRNTVTGSSTADVVVLLTDARKGVLEQTRRHLAVAALLRVPHVIVAVNKIDLVDFSEEVYNQIAADIRRVAADLGVAHIHTLPTSALNGDNIVESSTQTPWYDGPSLLDLLETLPVDAAGDEPGFRFPVQLVLRPQQAAADESLVDYRGYAGQIAAGSVSVGDEIIAQPSGRRSRVVGIDLGDRSLESARAPQSVTLRLADDIDIARGDTVLGGDSPLQAVREFDAIVCWLSDRPLAARGRYLVKHGSASVQAMVTAVESRLDLDTLAGVPASSLQLNDIGRVSLKLAVALPLEDYTASRSGGAFLLVDAQEGGTLAAGMVSLATPVAHDAASDSAASIATGGWVTL